MKINVIYILGTGHSSSTLINSIIGVSENSISLGELKLFVNFLHKKKLKNQKKNLDFLCDCKKELSECDFWSPITKKINTKNLLSRKLSFKNRIKFIFYLFFKYPNIHPNYSEDQMLFQEALSQAKIIKCKEVNYIVDSSKDLNRLMYLCQNKNLNVHVIHLIRDGRAVINSHEKMNKNWLKTYMDWFIFNNLSKIFLKIHKINYLNLSYDKFAQNPEYYIKKLNEKFNLKINSKTYLQDIQKEKWHNFAGNSARWDKFTKIKYDQSWKRRMPKWKQYILTVLCYIPNRLWVYNKKF